MIGLGALKTVGSFVVSLLTGGSLDKILDIIDKKVDEGTRKEELKAEVTMTWIKAQSALLVGRTWWFQLFFVIPAGIYWSALLFVSAFPAIGWTVHRMPGFAEEIYFMIVSALFIVDGGKALLGRFTK